jgi:uncharacterized protein DUF6286
MRLLNRPLAFILAVALAVASVIVIIEVIAFAVHASPVVVHWPTWYHWANTTRWDATVVRGWAIVLIVAGVLILALELKPRRVTRLRLRSSDQATDAALTRSGLAGTLRAAATSIDGVTSAAVTVRRRRARVTAQTAARGRAAATALKPPLTQALRSRLDDLDLYRAPRLKVRLTTRNR